MKHLLFVPSLAFALHAEAADRPSILVILIDDLGYGDVGCYGATAVKTPNVDRLAREGLRFTDGPTSSPAKASPSISRPSPGPKRTANTNVELGNEPQGQLCDVAADPGETRNVLAAHPEKVAELHAILEQTRAAGRLP